MDKILSKFKGMSKQYAKYRPLYAKGCIDYILSKEKNINCIADIWAWTWKLSKQFLDRGIEVFAVEPNIEMQEQAMIEIGENKLFHPVLATAENTTLPDNSIDFITVGQAFHRFDAELFKKECKRILKKDARVAILYNNWDRSSELIQKIDQLSKKYCPLYKWSSWWLANHESVFENFFTTYEKKIFPNDYHLSLEIFLWLNFSASYAPKKWEENYEIYWDELINLFNRYSNWNTLIMPNNTILRVWYL